MELRPARRGERDQVLDLLARWYGDRAFFARYNRFGLHDGEPSRLRPRLGADAVGGYDDGARGLRGHPDNFFMWRAIALDKLAERLGVAADEAETALFAMLQAPNALYWTADRF